MEADGSPTDKSEAAAHRRWLITVAITVVFGCFGAVMAYLSYANNTRSSAPATGRSSTPSTAPTTAPTVAPGSAPSSDEEHKGNPHTGKPDKTK